MTHGAGFLLVCVTSEAVVQRGLTGRMLASVRAQDESVRVVLVARAVDPAVLSALADQPDLVLAVPHAISLSRARNLALVAAEQRGWLTRASYVGFPDDDCWYPRGLLPAVRRRLDAGAACVITDYGSDAPEKVVDSGVGDERLPPARIFRLATSNNSFFRSALFEAGVIFDERLGLGARFGSSEDLDVALAAAEHGPVIYLPTLAVGHPRTPEKAALYYPGNIAVLAKHSRTHWWARRLLARQLLVGLWWWVQCRLSTRLAVAAARAGYRMVRPRRQVLSFTSRAPGLLPATRMWERVSPTRLAVCTISTACPHAAYFSDLESMNAAGVPVHLWLLEPSAVAPSVATVGRGPGAKFDLVRKLITGCEADSDVVILDDDVEWKVNDLVGFVALARQAGLDLAQPAHTYSSYSSHPITVGRPRSLVRLTTFVEIGPVIYVSGRARSDLLAPDVAIGMGFGSELRWWDVAQRSNYRLGIVDAARIRHVRPVGGGYDIAAAREASDRLVAQSALGSWQQMQQTLDCWRPRQPAPPWL